MADRYLLQMYQWELDCHIALGYSESAVKIHLLVAIYAYLLLAWVKASLKSLLTISEVSKVIEVSILSKADIRELLDVPVSLTLVQNINEL